MNPESPATPQPGDAIAALLARGVLSDQQVAEAQEIAAQRQIPILQALRESGVLSQADAIRVGAESAGLEFVDLAEFRVESSALLRLDGPQARRLTAIPLDWAQPGVLRIAVPLKQVGDLHYKDDLARLTRARVEFVVALRADILAKIEQVYLAEETEDLAESLEGNAQTVEEFDSLGTQESDEPIVKFVNLVIGQAIDDRASDIHVEPGEKDLVVRYAIDGVLHVVHTVPRSAHPRVISRLKIMADMTVDERRKPQDGRLTYKHRDRKVDLRVATVPSVWGEAMTMRILESATTRLSLTELGFSAANLRAFETAFRKPYGMVLVCGQTGSGKTTTLYSALSVLADSSKKVVTIEDPVEYRIPGVIHTQVNDIPGVDYTFATALPAFMRMAPHVILVGEIRDTETARVAIEAAGTGHLVMSTVHTNTAASALTRLIDLGAAPYAVAGAVDAVVAQRLCRRLCDCREQYTPSAEDLVSVGFPWEAGTPLPTLYRPVGCKRCSGTGYRGQMAVHEVLTVTPEIRRLALTGASSNQIHDEAVAAGMTVLREDGWAKVLDGLTSIDEIVRVVV